MAATEYPEYGKRSVTSLSVVRSDRYTAWLAILVMVVMLSLGFFATPESDW